jgi:hypothetical protein
MLDHVIMNTNNLIGGNTLFVCLLIGITLAEMWGFLFCPPQKLYRSRLIYSLAKFVLHFHLIFLPVSRKYILWHVHEITTFTEREQTKLVNAFARGILVCTLLGNFFNNRLTKNICVFNIRLLSLYSKLKTYELSRH